MLFRSLAALETENRALTDAATRRDAAPEMSQQIVLDVPQSLRSAITSEVSINVTVGIDRNGRVAKAEVASIKGEGASALTGEALKAARRFRFRLIGTEVVRSYGVEITGQYTDVVQPPCYRAMVERHYGDSVDRREPLLHRMRFVEHPGKVHELTRLTLPLSEDGSRVNMLMLASVAEPELAHFRERRRAARAASLAGG